MLYVSIRAGILNLLRYFAETLQMAILYISHDLSTMRHICSQVAIMYLGRIVEIGEAGTVFADPAHPYTRALIAAVPAHDAAAPGRARPPGLKGEIADPARPPSGCRFHTRCPLAVPRCSTDEPVLRPLGPGRQVACHLAA